MKQDIHAIKVSNVTKIYPIYKNKNDRLKESLSFIRKKYHSDFFALNNISFEIKKGETIGIIGQNGSGKSTLLKILTGVLSPTFGQIEIEGKISALLELGAGFNPEMTGLENIYLNGTIMGYSKEQMEARIPKIIEFAEIGDFINQPVKTYSSGMFSRLAFAVAINVEPEILIVDEALSVGDVFFQNKCFRKMEQMRNSGITVIMVSHDLSTIKQMCDRVMWINSGHIVSFGNKAEVCEQYFANQIQKQNSNISEKICNQKFDKIIEKQGTSNIFPKIQSTNGNDIFSEKLQLVSFYIKDELGNKVNALEVDKNYSFHLISKNLTDIENAIFGVRLETIKGIKVYGANTFLSGAERTVALKKDTYTEVIFFVKLPKIIRGEYLITIAIIEGSQKEHKVLTWLNSISSVHIVNNGICDTLFEMDCKIEEIIYSEKNVQLY